MKTRPPGAAMLLLVLLLGFSRGAVADDDGDGGNGGTLFWDLIHPSTNAHALIAFQAFGMVTGGGAEDHGWLAMR